MDPPGKTPAVLAALLAAVLVATACGDSDDVESRGRAERRPRAETEETTTTAAAAPTTTAPAPGSTTTGPAGGPTTTGPAGGPTTTAPAGPSTTQAGPPAQQPQAPPTQLTLVAKNIAFDTQRLQMPAAQEVTLVFDNQDEGVPHNVHIKGLPGGDVITKIESGPVKQEVKLKVDQPGSYAFLCDVHPQQMVGNVEVR